MGLESFSDEIDIEERMKIEVIKDPYSIQNSYNNLVRSACREILLFLPTTSAFVREEKIGIIQSLIDAAARGVNVRVLTPADEKIRPRIEAMLDNVKNNIAIRRVGYKPSPHAAMENRTKILVIDRKTYLVVELKDDSEETFLDAVRSAIQSDSRSTVMSYVTMFESLWQESDLYDQLEAHDRMQREFINIASHELRTPIQPILGMIEMLDDRFAGEECRISKEELQLLVRNARRLARLSCDILEVSRIESNSLNLHIEKFDVNEKIRDMVFDARKLIEPGRRLEIKIKNGEPIFVEADKIKIFEVIMNLLANAIKFTEEGTITVRAGKFGRYARIEVKDTGKGIDPNIMPKLFTKFTSTADQGTGLGLFISKSIVEAHDGRIWAENNRNEKGASFAFTLPIADASA